MSHAPLVRRLLDPRAYPHPVEQVRLVETHISWVFLTGRYVYKVKKPVDFGFLDFASLEKRRHYCHEEVRLNRRFAPSLYLAAVPITGRPQEAVVAGDGEPTEWAVQLAEFDEACRLDRLLDVGGLGAADCDTLGREIAAVQQRLEVASRDTPWGTAATAAEAFRMNLAQIVEHRPAAADASTALTRWMSERIASQSDAFAMRRATGKVRQCHGDLHLANLVRHEGHFLAFDAIEFSDTLRWIDVASDIAFLAMDLESRGRPDLAAIVTSGWIEASDDHAATAVLPIYLVYRATVRAAVAAIRAAQPDADTDAAAAESDRYLALARSLAAPGRPVLYATCGPSGSGKTTLARRVVATASAVHLRSDVERKRAAGMSPTERPADTDAAARLYSEAATRDTYNRLARLARGMLGDGARVVVDAACTARWQREVIAEAAAATGADLVWIVPQVPEPVLIERVEARRQRDHDASDATAAIVRSQLERFEPIRDAELRAYPRTKLLRLPEATSSADAFERHLLAITGSRSAVVH
jgi:aminoglycoside phosphotransferase family enzyme/predicted kinase